MKLVLVAIVAALLSSPGAAGAAQHKRGHHKTRAHRPPRARARPQVAPRGARDSVYVAGDELALSPSLMRKLQSNLRDGGYLRGTLDGRMTARTRRALTAFQREYHLRETGRLDRGTADALLGRDVIGAYLATRD